MDRTTAQRELRKAERHVAEGAARIVEYECRVAELERDGDDASNARALLTTLRKSQVLQEGSITALRAELARRHRAAAGA